MGEIAERKLQRIEEILHASQRRIKRETDHADLKNAMAVSDLDQRLKQVMAETLYDIHQTLHEKWDGTERVPTAEDVEKVYKWTLRRIIALVLIVRAAPSEEMSERALWAIKVIADVLKSDIQGWWKKETNKLTEADGEEFMRRFWDENEN